MTEHFKLFLTFLVKARVEERPVYAAASAAAQLHCPRPAIPQVLWGSRRKGMECVWGKALKMYCLNSTVIQGIGLQFKPFGFYRKLLQVYLH